MKHPRMEWEYNLLKSSFVYYSNWASSYDYSSSNANYIVITKYVIVISRTMMEKNNSKIDHKRETDLK